MIFIVFFKINKLRMKSKEVIEILFKLIKKKDKIKKCQINKVACFHLAQTPPFDHCEPVTNISYYMILLLLPLPFSVAPLLSFFVFATAIVSIAVALFSSMSLSRSLLFISLDF
ncbi:uncharacterized protein DS421_20g698640 [Arachis hypogaea]|nr:uncharacterized protein DS421_20g698640 [Arachis hypogaea]